MNIWVNGCFDILHRGHLELFKFAKSQGSFLVDSDYELETCVSLHNIDYLIVGSDYRDKDVIGSEYAKEVIFFDRIGNYSTTNILEKT